MDLLLPSLDPSKAAASKHMLGPGYPGYHIPLSHTAKLSAQVLETGVSSGKVLQMPSKAAAVPACTRL